jgi:hypothetical protein
MDIEGIRLFAVLDLHDWPPPPVRCRTAVITRISSAVSRKVTRIVP